MELKPVLSFLKNLSKNNNKEWFDTHKKEYEIIKKEYLIWISELIKSISKFDPEYAGIEAKNCVFRINRDVRFSKDKSPYKTNFGAYINLGGKNSQMAGYYLHLEPGKSFIAGGMYMPQGETLAKVRQEIDYNLKAFEKIVTSSTFIKNFNHLKGDTLARPPKGYDENNPAINYLKHKSFLAWHEVKDDVVLSKEFSKHVLQVFKAMKPLNDFLNSSLE